MSHQVLLSLVDLPLTSLVVNKPSQRSAVSLAVLAELRITSDASQLIIRALAMSRNPDLAGREVEVEQVIDHLGGKEAVGLVRHDFAAHVDHLNIGHAIPLFIFAKRHVGLFVQSNPLLEIIQGLDGVLTFVVRARQFQAHVSLEQLLVHTATFKEQDSKFGTRTCANVVDNRLPALHSAVGRIQDSHATTFFHNVIQQFVEAFQRNLFPHFHGTLVLGVEEGRALIHGLWRRFPSNLFLFLFLVLILPWLAIGRRHDSASTLHRRRGVLLLTVD